MFEHRNTKFLKTLFCCAIFATANSFAAPEEGPRNKFLEIVNRLLPTRVHKALAIGIPAVVIIGGTAALVLWRNRSKQSGPKPGDDKNTVPGKDGDSEGLKNPDGTEPNAEKAPEEAPLSDEDNPKTMPADDESDANETALPHGETTDPNKNPEAKTPQKEDPPVPEQNPEPDKQQPKPQRPEPKTPAEKAESALLNLYDKVLTNYADNNIDHLIKMQPPEELSEGEKEDFGRRKKHLLYWYPQQVARAANEMLDAVKDVSQIPATADKYLTHWKNLVECCEGIQGQVMPKLGRSNIDYVGGSEGLQKMREEFYSTMCMKQYYKHVRRDPMPLLTRIAILTHPKCQTNMISPLPTVATSDRNAYIQEALCYIIKDDNGENALRSIPALKIIDEQNRQRMLSGVIQQANQYANFEREKEQIKKLTPELKRILCLETT